MFILPSISMFKWLHRFLTISAALPLSDLIIGIENVTSVSGKVSLIRVFRSRSLSNVSLDVERVASFVPMWTMKCSSFYEGWVVHDN